LNENFIKLIKVCQKFLPKTLIIVLTNGTRFVDFKFTKKVAEVSNNIFIAVSLYSDNDIIHDRLTGVEGSFYQTVKGLHNLALFKQKIEIRVVLTKMNIERLPNIAEFIYRNFPFVTHVALMGLEITGNAKKYVDLLWIDPYEYQKELLLTCKYLNRYNLHFSIYNHPLCVVPETLRKFCRQSISSWKKTYLDICEKCSVKSICGGLFSTSAPYYSKFLNPI
jgi:His-Xaa-Ser system radical SAM maturase HxsC